MKTVLLFGGSGLVGSGIKQLLSDRYRIIAPAHDEVDVIRSDHVTAIIEQIQPNNIIYAVGLASIDRAEQEPELANLLNVKAPALVAKVAASFGIPLLYFSTNAVFDGTKKNRPYKETDKTNPKSGYGKSKLMGEQIVMNISDKNYVVRFIMPYPTTPHKRKNFTWTILDAFKEGKEIYGITDQVINPICVSDIAEAVHALIATGAGGIYHLGATDYVTNIEFIKKLARIFNFNFNLIKEISFEEFFRGKKAPRTKFCWLDTLKIRKKIGNNILHTIDEGILLFKKNLEKDTNS
ncbi:NAD(P)-dependent oxidoreductase [Candidatus Daviesbacteria bacterium]|nr:NAD(P)-dependent oxidoreductase [Candidatus Daviesbacteria bacterium]